MHNLGERARILRASGIEAGYADTPGGKIYYNSKGSGNMTLLCVPGGPGGGIYHLLPLFKLSDHRIRVVIYDQIGVGQSQVPQNDYYCMDNYAEEIDCIRRELRLDKVILLGHSFGDFIVNHYMANSAPKGVAGVIHYSGGASLSLYVEEANRLVDALPAELVEIVRKCDSERQFNHPAYLLAQEEFSRRHGSTLPMDTFREEFLGLPEPYPSRSSQIMWGPSDWAATGRIQGFEVLDRLSELTQPHLILNGRYDMCTPKTGKAMAERLRNAKCHVFRHSAHVAHLEET